MDRARRCEEWERVSNLIAVVVDTKTRKPGNPSRFNPYKTEKPKPPKPEVSPFLRWL
jgi:hypothetical protein